MLAVARVAATAIWIIGFLPIVGVLRLCGAQTASLRRIFFRGLCRIVGIDLIVHGAPAEDRPVLIASNHISYLDIFAFGAACELEFVSKSEVADWPLFGLLAKMADTVFIERRRSQTQVARDLMSERMAAHRVMVFFPEATSGDGNRLLPFKSALFSAAQDLAAGKKPVTLQPAAIAYTRLNGLPLGVGWRPFFAWYGDMTMLSHLWQFLQLGRTTVEIAFLPPLTETPVSDRKAMASAAENAVRGGFNALIQGRAPV